MILYSRRHAWLMLGTWDGHPRRVSPHLPLEQTPDPCQPLSSCSYTQLMILRRALSANAGIREQTIPNAQPRYPVEVHQRRQQNHQQNSLTIGGRRMLVRNSFSSSMEAQLPMRSKSDSDQ